MAEVVLESVSKSFPNGVQAVRNLSLTVNDGELVVIVGPSGSGKTTVLRLIGGLEEPTGGAIRIGGVNVTHMPAHRRNVAMVFQRPALYPYLTVRENLAFGLKMAGGAAKEIAPRVEDAARLLGIQDLLDRQPAQLSGGQQQRVALGRAIVRSPGVLLLDEPLASLDSRLREELRRELHLLQKRLSATMILVTHDQVEAMTLADRVLVLHDGVAQQVGSPLDLYHRPVNRLVAGSLGCPTMNFLDGQLSQRDHQTWFDLPGFSLAVGPALAECWRPMLGRPVTLGVRPTDVGVVRGSPDLAPKSLGDAPAGFGASLVEPLGPEWLVTLEHAGQHLTAVTRDAPTVGQVVQVVIDFSQSHLFDRVSGQVLSHGLSSLVSGQ